MKNNILYLISNVFPKSISPKIIYYHSIDNKSNSVSLCKFEKQILWLLNNNYKIVTTREFANMVYKNKICNEKIIAITFDDGYQDNYLNAFKILQKYNLKATIYIIAELINVSDPNYTKYKLYPNRKMLLENQIIEMSEYGIEIGSHTLTHINLAKTLKDNEDIAFREIYKSKKILENIINKEITSFSYPNGQRGTFNENTKKLIKLAGYENAVTTMINDMPWQKKDIFQIQRIEIKGSDSLKIFKQKVLGKYDYLSYYYNLFDLSKKW